MTTSRPLVLALAALALTLNGCLPSGPSTAELPGGFQDIKLGATLNQIKIKTGCEQPAPDHLRLPTPTDRIERIDCLFTQSGDHLVEIHIAHFVKEDVSFDSFLEPLIKKYGDARRSTEDHEGVPILVARWTSKEREYVVRCRPLDPAGARIALTEQLVDRGFLRRKQQNEVWDGQRDKWRLFESGKF
jgi:hypothetical protein